MKSPRLSDEEKRQRKRARYLAHFAKNREKINARARELYVQKRRASGKSPRVSYSHLTKEENRERKKIACRIRYAKNKEIYARNWREKKAKNPEFYRKREKAYSAMYEKERIPRRRKSGAAKDKALRRDFGIGIGEFNALLESQGGVCKLCQNPETIIYKGFFRLLSVDHCHVTGKIRGLICYNCNLGLGKFKDNPLLLRQAAEYVASYGALS